MKFKKCSIGLDARVKDRRNLIANYSHYLDSTLNIEYTGDDDKIKCDIFEIDNSSIDFITKDKMSGIGDHYYPLSKDYKTENRIGSDSGWNRIPVSGNNSKYKDNAENMEKIKRWIYHCETREARLFYILNPEQVNIINKGIDKLIEVNNSMFEDLKTHPV